LTIAGRKQKFKRSWISAGEPRGIIKEAKYAKLIINTYLILYNIHLITYHDNKFYDWVTVKYIWIDSKLI